MQWVLALLIAAFLVIVGVQILHVVLVDWMQLYKDLTLEQACLIFLVILQTATLVQLILWRRELEWERTAEQPPRMPRPSETTPRPKAPVRQARPERKAAGPGPSQRQQSGRASSGQRYYRTDARSTDPRRRKR